MQKNLLGTGIFKKHFEPDLPIEHIINERYHEKKQIRNTFTGISCAIQKCEAKEIHVERQEKQNTRRKRYPHGRSLYFFRASPEITEEKIQQACGKYGKVEDVRMFKTKKTTNHGMVLLETKTDQQEVYAKRHIIGFELGTIQFHVAREIYKAGKNKTHDRNAK